MNNHFTSLTDAEGFDELLARSHDAPVILFKHSTTCPISAAAYKEMAEVQSPVALVVVQRARDVSREVEARTGVRHESPQTIILRDGQAKWSASHWNITAEAVARAFAEQQSATGAAQG